MYKSSDASAYVEQSITVSTIKSELVAIIRGASEYTVGRSGGQVVIDGSLTYDPDNEARAWVYTWECTQVNCCNCQIVTLLSNGIFCYTNETHI